MSGSRLTHYIKSHSTQIMTGYTVLALALFTAVPQLRALTSHAFYGFWESVRSDAYAWAFPLALIVLLLGIQLNNTLEKLNCRWLEWSLFPVKENIIYRPIRWKRLGLPYVLMLFFCMPLLAFVEELIFREVVGQLGVAILLVVSGPIFGVVHISSGVTVRMTIYLSLVGLLFAGIYLMAGLIGVFLVHASYNLIAITWVTFELRLRAPLGNLLSRSATTRRHLPTVTAWLHQSQASAIH